MEREVVRKKLIANIVLFILMVMLVLFDSPLSDRGSIYIDQSSNIFVIELFLILLHTLINRSFPTKTLISTPWVLIGVTTWLCVFLLLGLYVAYVDGWRGDWTYFYMAFHAVFFTYALDSFSEIRSDKSIVSDRFLKSKTIRDRVLLILLCGLTFSIALTSGQNSFYNATIVLRHEVVFIVAYMLINQSIPDAFRLHRNNIFVYVLFVLWAVLVTISFVFSQYELMVNYKSIDRYYQTIFHVVFFIYVYQFLVDKNKDDFRLLLMLPLSVIFIVLIFLIVWFGFGESYKFGWFNNPPLADHIRHIGYIATASTSVAIIYMLYPEKTNKNIFLYLFLLFISSALLVWTGGRAAVISIVAVSLLSVLYLAYIKKLKISRLVIACVAVFLSVYFVEIFKVFSWNGVFSMISRTEEASDINSVTSNRVAIWLSVIESLKGNWLLGLGPQSYYFMPNLIYGRHPHNIFLQFILEWGVLGAVVFLSLLLFAGVKILSYMKNNVASVYFLSGAAVWFSLSIHSLVDGIYYHAQPSYYVSISLAICLSVINARKNIHTKGRRECESFKKLNTLPTIK